MTEEINRYEMDEDVYDIIVLDDDEGNKHEFIHLHTLEVDGSTYYVLLPVEEEEDVDDEEAEAIILKLEVSEDGEEMLVDIEDDEEWEKIADAWEEIEEEDFEED
ncbi:MAG: DUF1292 domain-containing protein [Desulfitobacteriia bacterium]